MTVWTAWASEDLAGICALKAHDQALGELKSMRTDPRRLRRGVAAALLERAIDQARRRRMRRLSPETGSGEAFEPPPPYRRRGFADYAPSAFNQFLHLDL